MSYSRELICRRVAELLAATPRLRLDEVAARLGVERHTVTRALARAGQDFRRLRDEATKAALGRLLTGDAPRSAKMLARELGFSSAAALSHYLQRRGCKGAPEWHHLNPNVSLTAPDCD